MQSTQLSDDNTRLIGNDPEYQHIVIDEVVTPSALLPLLVALDTYLKGLVESVSVDDIQRNISKMTDSIVNQLQLDNSQELAYAIKNTETCDSIISYQLFDLATLVPDTLKLIKAIRAVFVQYTALLDYIPRYTEAYAYAPSDDDSKHLLYYTEYTDNAVKGYVYPLLESTATIDAVESQLARRGLYKLLLTADVTLIEPNTEIKNFVAVLQAVQNNRIYRSRELMIIAVNEAIATSNLIRLMWLLIQLNYEALVLENKDNSDLYEELKKLIDEFEKTRDPTLLDKIPELIRQIEEELKNKANESTKTSQISADLTTIGKLKDKSAIQRYIDTLDGFIAKVDAINIRLAQFNYELDYSGLQSLLNKLEILSDLLASLLGDPKLSKYFEKANEIIRAVNRTTDAIKSVNCLIKQAMCLIASTANFTNTIVAPAIKNLQDTIKGLGDDLETASGKFVKDTLSPFNDAIKRVVYEQARGILKGRAYELTTALNRDDTFTTNYNSLVDAVIDGALGNSTSAMDYLKATSKQMMDDIASSFEITDRQATNCPPLTVKGSLSIPNLSSQSNIPSLSNINLRVEC